MWRTSAKRNSSSLNVSASFFVLVAFDYEMFEAYETIDFEHLINMREPSVILSQAVFC